MARRASGADEFEIRRRRMVERDLRRRGIRDRKVLDAMSRVPRHLFVPSDLAYAAYEDCPLPIGIGQTISQPYIVALMTEALELEGGERVLELGTGSGYQAAVLAEVGAQVWTIERLAHHGAEAARRLRSLGHEGIQLRVGDGTLGWPEEAPFDRILVTGALPSAPLSLLEQLVEEGVFVAPIGVLFAQQLVRIVYHADGGQREDLGGCRFVPMIGEHGWSERAFGAPGE